eukprot:6704700-Pyramimonas_sp.AAC.1
MGVVAGGAGGGIVVLLLLVVGRLRTVARRSRSGGFFVRTRGPRDRPCDPLVVEPRYPVWLSAPEARRCLPSFGRFRPPGDLDKRTGWAGLPIPFHIPVRVEKVLSSLYPALDGTVGAHGG